MNIQIEASSLCVAYASFLQDERLSPECRRIGEEHVLAAMKLIAAEFDLDLAAIKEVSRLLTRPHWEALKRVLDMWLVAGDWFRPLGGWWVDTDPDPVRRAERIRILVARTAMR